VAYEEDGVRAIVRATPIGRRYRDPVAVLLPGAQKRWDGNGNARTGEAVRPVQWARSVAGGPSENPRKRSWYT
jgi:hypothetical protein